MSTARDYAAIYRELSDVLTIVSCADAATAAQAAKRLPALAHQLLDVAADDYKAADSIDDLDGYFSAALPARLLTSPKFPGHGGLASDWFHVHDEAGHILLLVKTHGNLKLLHEMIRAYVESVEKRAAIAYATRRRT